MTYWGKAEKGGAPGGPFHPLVCHSLDVAAVAERLLERMPWLTRALLRILGCPDSERETVVRTIVFLAAIHDLGKFANGFQKMRPELWEPTASPEERASVWRYGGPLRHDALGAALLQERGIVRSWFPGPSPRPAIALLSLVQAACGHHGSPPSVAQAAPSLRSCFSARNIDDARSFVDWARAALGPAEMPVFAEAKARRASLLLAGLLSVADWIGSNRDWFEYAPDADDPLAYLELARKRAAHAVAEARVVPRPPVPAPTFASLYPEVAAPSPLQAAVDGMSLDGQCLTLIEEMTGGGKTEAANLLAAKLMACGAANGVYVALPTTATADAMAERQVRMYKRFFNEDGASFVVLHSNGARAQAELSDAHGGTCAAWMTEDRRRKTVAEVGVGTIDQALLAAVPSKFATVRLFGLAGKVVVVDEAHSYDGYTQELLIGAVRLFASVGASVALVSATLSKAVKRRLATAFCEGAGFPLGDAALLDDDRYPLVTLLDRQGLRPPIAPPPTPRAPRPKTVRLVNSVAEAEALVLTAARSGRCVLWSRNTVDDAIRAARRLRDDHGHADVTVYHARFPDSLRWGVQKRLLARFGKDSRGAERAGGIVVATQIVESSFDIDVDLVVVDLKPMDAVVQTAGRGCRHARDRDGDPLASGAGGVDAREPHEVVVVSADPVSDPDADWHRRLFPAAAGIYENVGALWRTARALRSVGAIAYPDGVRPLIESVFGTDEAPAALEQASLAAEGHDAAERSLARPCILDPATGYEHRIAWGDDERIPTRLGVSTDLVLVKEDGAGAVKPFDGADWSSGCLRLSSKRARGVLPHGLPDAAAEAIAAQARHAAIVRVVADGGDGVWRGALQGAEKPLPFSIHPLYGLAWDAA
jgi:CRISPR-associated endonuclease/helicase Cas3